MSGMLALTLAHTAMLPVTFNIEAYLGVMSILAAGMAGTATLALCMRDSASVWMLALVQGVLNAAGYLGTRLVRLPFAADYSFHRWAHPPALTVGLLGAAVAVLAAWHLRGERLMPPACSPVTCARERELLLRATRGYAQAPGAETFEPRKTSSKSPATVLRATPRRLVIFSVRIRPRHPRRSPAGSVARHLDR